MGIADLDEDLGSTVPSGNAIPAAPVYPTAAQGIASLDIPELPEGAGEISAVPAEGVSYGVGGPGALPMQASKHGLFSVPTPAAQLPTQAQTAAVPAGPLVTAQGGSTRGLDYWSGLPNDQFVKQFQALPPEQQKAFREQIAAAHRAFSGAPAVTAVPVAAAAPMPPDERIVAPSVIAGLEGRNVAPIPQPVAGEDINAPLRRAVDSLPEEQRKKLLGDRSAVAGAKELADKEREKVLTALEESKKGSVGKKAEEAEANWNGKEPPTLPKGGLQTATPETRNKFYKDYLAWAASNKEEAKPVEEMAAAPRITEAPQAAGSRNRNQDIVHMGPAGASAPAGNFGQQYARFAGSPQEPSEAGGMGPAAGFPNRSTEGDELFNPQLRALMAATPTANAGNPVTPSYQTAVNNESTPNIVGNVSKYMDRGLLAPESKEPEASAQGSSAQEAAPTAGMEPFAKTAADGAEGKPDLSAWSGLTSGGGGGGSSAASMAAFTKARDAVKKEMLAQASMREGSGDRQAEIGKKVYEAQEEKSGLGQRMSVADQKQAAELQTQQSEQAQKDKAQADAAANFKVDPDRYIHKKGLFSKIATTFAAALEGFARGQKGDFGPNSVNESVKQAINADIQDQLQEGARQATLGKNNENLASKLFQITGNYKQTVHAAQGMMLNAAADHVEALGNVAHTQGTKDAAYDSAQTLRVEAAKSDEAAAMAALKASGTGGGNKNLEEAQKWAAAQIGAGKDPAKTIATAMTVFHLLPGQAGQLFSLPKEGGAAAANADANRDEQTQLAAIRALVPKMMGAWGSSATWPGSDKTAASVAREVYDSETRAYFDGLGYSRGEIEKIAKPYLVSVEARGSKSELPNDAMLQRTAALADAKSSGAYIRRRKANDTGPAVDTGSEEP